MFIKILVVMWDLACAALVVFFASVMFLLPVRIILRIGRFFGGIAFMANKGRRIIGYANMKAAYCREKTPREIKNLLKSVYKRMVETFFEVVALPRVNGRYLDKFVRIKNTHNFWKVYFHKEGAILLTAHFGNWELSGMASADRGFPLVVLAREQKMKMLNGLINRLRESKGLKVVVKGITTRYIVKALHERKMIGMVADQDAGRDGHFSEFFGRPASTALGPYKFAARTNAIIQPAFMCRKKGPYHDLVLEEPILINKGDDVGPIIDRYNEMLEHYVRKYPDHWLWLHKRWKSTPVKRVLILSDGKKGHLNQALAVAGEIDNYRKRHPGYKEGNTVVEIAEVRFRNSFYRTLFNLASPFFSWRCQGCLACLKACLKEDSYKDLAQRYADIVVNCGSSLAGVNRLLSIECNAKNIVIMKPSFLGLNKFNLAVVPRHDVRRKQPGHVVVTDTVPNLIGKEYLESSSGKIGALASFSKPFKIGVLLGGNNADFMFSEGLIKKVLDSVLDASEKTDAEILLTTSRRTPRNIEEIVKQRLSPKERCKFLVIPREKDIPDAVGAILGLSDVIVVSGESASMVSEAVSSGKRTIVFKPERRKRRVTKFEKMLERLSAGGYVDIREPGVLSEAICNSLSPKAAPKKLEDRFRIYEQMWRVGV